jgi:phage shock protein B
MTAALILLVIFGSIITMIAMVLGFILLLTRFRKGGTIGRGEQAQTNETRLIQEIHQGLARMEERVNALETILFDQEMKEERKEESK